MKKTAKQKMVEALAIDVLRQSLITKEDVIEAKVIFALAFGLHDIVEYYTPRTDREVA